MDSGLYQHKEKNPIRRYIRSHLAHSLTAPLFVTPLRDHARYQKKSGITDWSISHSRTCVQMRSFMFPGFEAKRCFDFNVPPGGGEAIIEIKDSVTPQTQEAIDHCGTFLESQGFAYASRFVLPVDKRINIFENKGFIEVVGERKRMKIQIQGDFESVEIMPVAVPGDTHGWRSREFGLLEVAQILEIRYASIEVEVGFTISWQDLTY